MLSIGQQRRVALARANAARPQLLLLDEPFSNLDPLLREELMAEVRRLAGEINAALVLVTHDVFEALVLTNPANYRAGGRACGGIGRTRGAAGRAAVPAVARVRGANREASNARRQMTIES